MNRKIKFRALKDDMSNCNFVYGQLVYDAIGTPRITEVDSSGKGLTFHTCLKNTESQFIGLLDKNGKEVYEGDLLNWPHLKSEIVEVYFNENEFVFVGRPVDKEQETESWLDKKCEVIGNIYENPEFLTNSKTTN
jgi:uncharacterized phage protein (TIGR01671 family)